MSFNSYTESILTSIDLVNDWRFAHVEEEFAATCQTNLVEYLVFLVSIYNKEATEEDEKTIDEITEKINEKKEELLGSETLGKFSELIITEALYYYRLMLLPNTVIQQLINMINSYNSHNQMKIVSKINALIVLNICTYGAGTSVEKPLFNLSTDEDTSKEQKDLEVSIMFLLRNINDLHHTLVEPLYNSPLETLLKEDEEDEEVQEEQVQLEDDKETEIETETDVKGFFTSIEKNLLIGSTALLTIAILYIISSASTLRTIRGY